MPIGRQVYKLQYLHKTKLVYRLLIAKFTTNNPQTIILF